jgi:2,5-furandicarboxylate decarboxylase 1
LSKDLRTFLDQVRKLGPEFYVEVNRKLSPELEVQVIQQKLAKDGRFPVIYCPEIEGSKLPLVTDLVGSHEMVGLAFGIDPKEVAADKDKIFFEYRRRGGEGKPVKTVSSSSAPVKEVVLKGKDIDLGLLPIPKHAPLNSGRYISVGQMVCRDPSTGIYNSGIYRHEVKGKDKLGAKVNPVKHAAYAWRQYGDLSKPMEVVIFIGHHPATALGSCWNGGMDDDELEIMGGYLGEPLEVTQGETVDLPVPAHAEIAIEGIIDTSREYTDGPFSEWAGYYGEKKDCYLIQVTAITMRHDAIYHDLDPSHWEHNLLGTLGIQSTAYDAVKKVVPSVKSVYLPPSGGGFITCYISIKKRVPGEAKRAGWAAVNSYLSTHIAIVVDEDIDVYNEEEVLWAVATRCCPDIDIDIIPRTVGGPLVPTSYDETRLKRGRMASKMVIDATMPVELPFPTRIRPPEDLWERIKLSEYLK